MQEVRHTMRGWLDEKDEELGEKDKQILEARREAYQAADKLRRQQHNFELLIGRLPMDVRQRINEEQQKMADQATHKKERGISR